MKGDRWICGDCKGKMYVLKYKDTKKSICGMKIKTGVCYYCGSEKLKYIGENKGVKIKRENHTQEIGRRTK